eukprot:1154920-Pelagomonas_calceolata.AAC.2
MVSATTKVSPFTIHTRHIRPSMSCKERTLANCSCGIQSRAGSIICPSVDHTGLGQSSVLQLTIQGQHEGMQASQGPHAPLGDVGHVANEVNAHSVHHFTHHTRGTNPPQVRGLLQKQPPVIRLQHCRDLLERCTYTRFPVMGRGAAMLRQKKQNEGIATNVAGAGKLANSAGWHCFVTSSTQDSPLACDDGWRVEHAVMQRLAPLLAFIIQVLNASISRVHKAA